MKRYFHKSSIFFSCVGKPHQLDDDNVRCSPYVRALGDISTLALRAPAKLQSQPSNAATTASLCVTINLLVRCFESLLLDKMTLEHLIKRTRFAWEQNTLELHVPYVGD